MTDCIADNLFLLRIFPEKSAERARKSQTYITCIVLHLFQQNWRNVSVAKLIQFLGRTLTFCNSVVVGEVKLDIKIKVASLWKAIFFCSREHNKCYLSGKEAAGYLNSGSITSSVGRAIFNFRCSLIQKLSSPSPFFFFPLLRLEIFYNDCRYPCVKMLNRIRNTFS